MQINQKLGDTLSWEVSYTDELGGVTDLTNYTIKCQARSKSNRDIVLFSATSEGLEPQIDIYDPTEGLFRIVLDTTGFALGDYLVDIEYAVPGLIKSSETFDLVMIEDITKWLLH